MAKSTTTELAAWSVEMEETAEIWNPGGKGGTIPSHVNRTKMDLEFRGGYFAQPQASSSSSSFAPFAGE
jgi:hypothetical protein